MRNLIVIFSILLFCSIVSAKDKEPHILCSGAASCPASVSPVYWSDAVNVELALDEDTGCPSTATYTISGRNTGGTIWHVVKILSNSTVTSWVIDEFQWYPNFRAVSSDTTGCTTLEVNLWVTRN